MTRSARQMVAFASADPDDRAAFEANCKRVWADAGTVNRTIEADDVVVGQVAAFEQSDEREVTYWIAREHSGGGIATRALRLLRAELPMRPLHARAAADNAGSIRVLTNCGFVACGSDGGFAAACGEEVDEVLLRLDR